MASLSPADWWAGHPARLAAYRDSETAPHRQMVVEALRVLEPFGSVWEIGCHCGPMLAVIQRAYPEVLMGGCDVNEGAVQAAREQVAAVMLGAFPAVTADVPAGSVDVVLSCYTLAYQPPPSLGAALTEAARLARRGVVLCEPMAWNPAEVGTRDGVAFDEWRHNYLEAVMHLPAYHGWTAHCQELAETGSGLSGLIVLERP